MIKDETRKALSALILKIEWWRVNREFPSKEDQDIYAIYDEAEKFVKAFRRYELKIDD